MNLPIDIVSGNGPPRFKWRQIIHTPMGRKVVLNDGPLPSSLEDAVISLINLVKQQAQEIKGLQKQIEQHCDRIAKQSDQLSKNAEKSTLPVTIPIQPVKNKK